jgi:hypothetical protein
VIPEISKFYYLVNCFAAAKEKIKNHRDSELADVEVSSFASEFDSLGSTEHLDPTDHTLNPMQAAYSINNSDHVTGLQILMAIGKKK